MYLTRVDSLDICSFLHCYKTQQFCKKLSWFSRNVQRPILKQIPTLPTHYTFSLELSSIPGNFIKVFIKGFTIHTYFQYFRSQISYRYLITLVAVSSKYITGISIFFFLLFQVREQLRHSHFGDQLSEAYSMREENLDRIETVICDNEQLVNSRRITGTVYTLGQ